MKRKKKIETKGLVLTVRKVKLESFLVHLFNPNANVAD